MSQQTESDAKGHKPDDTDRNGPFYTFFVDGTEHHTDRPSMTCGEIMDLVGIPRSVGLVEVLEDGTERSCPENEVIEFEGPGRRLKKAPRFKRG